jgi:hypothetical protein
LQDTLNSTAWRRADKPQRVMMSAKHDDRRVNDDNIINRCKANAGALPSGKALSVRNPWGYWICTGAKRVENRSRRTSYLGRILIHAPIQWDSQFDDSPSLVPAAWPVPADAPPYSASLPCSAIIGAAELYDCVRDFPDPWAIPGYWHWLLRNAILYKRPILNVRGNLGIWDYAVD